MTEGADAPSLPCVSASAPSPTRTGRILRRIFIGLHISLAAAFCLLLVIGIVGQLGQYRPPEKPAPGSLAGCVAEIEALHGELIERLAALPTSRPAVDQGPKFDQWSRPFRKRVETAQLRCRRPTDATPGQAKTLRKALSKLQRFLDLSEIHVTHWSRHIGPAADEAIEALGRLHPVAEAD